MSRLLAVGDSITRGGGKAMLGVPARPWVAWLAGALGLELENRAEDGAGARQVRERQLESLPAGVGLACLYAGVNDARSPRFDAEAFGEDLRAVAHALAAQAGRLVVPLLPRDLGRPPAGQAKTDRARAEVRRAADEVGAVVVDLGDLGGWRWVEPDHVHLTARGQLEVARRALVALGEPPGLLGDAERDPGRARQAAHLLLVRPRAELRDRRRRLRERVR